MTGEASTTPPAAHELFVRVQEAATGTPYVVSPTDEGFDVTLDVVDARWYGLFDKAGLRKVFVHHVVVPEAGVYTITDDSRTVEWVAGLPTLGSLERVHGRVRELGVQKVWGFDEHGAFGAQADYRFSSEEGRDLVTGVAGQLGLRQQRGSAEKAGLAFALVAGVGSLAVAVVLVVAALLGKF